MTDHKPKYAGKIVSAVVIAIIVILAWSLLKQEPATNPTSDTNGDSQVADEIVDAQNYENIRPKDWEFYENAMEDIQSLDEGQGIEYGIVRDPIDENYVYFSTKTGVDEDGKVLLSIYKYNESDYSFERIWRQSFKNGEMFGLTEIPDMTPVVHVVGYENGKLIVLTQYMDDSPGPCSSPYMMGTGTQRGARNLMTLDLTNPYGGFEEYEPTEEALETSESWTEACKVEVGL